MKYLVSVAPEMSTDGEEYAPDGVPVIPRYPTGRDDMFMTIPGFMNAPYALVVEDETIDPDDIVEQLAERFPGLPRQLHANYVVATARIARKFTPGTRLRVRITPDTASVADTDDPTVFHNLWTEQPVSKIL